MKNEQNCRFLEYCFVIEISIRSRFNQSISILHTAGLRSSSGVCGGNICLLYDTHLCGPIFFSLYFLSNVELVWIPAEACVPHTCGNNPFKFIFKTFLARKDIFRDTFLLHSLPGYVNTPNLSNRQSLFGHYRP